MCLLLSCRLVVLVPRHLPVASGQELGSSAATSVCRCAAPPPVLFSRPAPDNPQVLGPPRGEVRYQSVHSYRALMFCCQGLIGGTLCQSLDQSRAFTAGLPLRLVLSNIECLRTPPRRLGSSGRAGSTKKTPESSQPVNPKPWGTYNKALQNLRYTCCLCLWACCPNGSLRN